MFCGRVRLGVVWSWGRAEPQVPNACEDRDGWGSAQEASTYASGKEGASLKFSLSELPQLHSRPVSRAPEEVSWHSLGV